jgi:hypothetical protein
MCLLSGAPTPYVRGSRHTEEKQRRDTQKREQRTQITEQIKGATRDADQGRSDDQSRGTRTAPKHNVRRSKYIVKEIVVTTSEVVINRVKNRTASSVTQCVMFGVQK